MTDCTSQAPKVLWHFLTTLDGFVAGPNHDMGWMTGILMFGMMALLLTLSLLFFQAAGGVAAVQAEFKNAVDPRVLEALKILQNGPEVARLLLQLFVFTTLLSMAGGALGAKMVGRS